MLAQLLLDGRQIPSFVNESNSLREAVSFSGDSRRGRANTGWPEVSIVRVMVALETAPGLPGRLFSANCLRISAYWIFVLNVLTDKLAVVSITQFAFKAVKRLIF